MNFLKKYLPYLFGNKKNQKYNLPFSILWGRLTFEESLMFNTLQGTIAHFGNSLDLEALSKDQIYHLFNFLEFFPHDFQNKLLKNFQKEFKLFQDSIEAPSLCSIELQEILNFKNNQLTLFAILPRDRNQLGKLLIRNSNGEFAIDTCGNIWSISILAKSGRGLNFTHSNGQTPLGVYTVDGVMPEANKNYEFGEFRRLILNFIPKSGNEESIIKLIPKSHILKAWWKQSVVGRDLGRSLLRIHGTGRKNKNPLTRFFPFVPTSGCIATNEAKFLGMEFSDQRKLLDVLMVMSNLEINFANEEKISGILYVIEYNDTFDKIQF